jgi:hypothetical protein
VRMSPHAASAAASPAPNTDENERISPLSDSDT